MSPACERCRSGPCLCGAPAFELGYLAGAVEGFIRGELTREELADAWRDVVARLPAAVRPPLLRSLPS